MSTALHDPEEISMSGALAAASHLVSDVGTEVWRCPEGELREAIDACAAHIAQSNGLLLRLIAEAQARGVPSQDGAPHTRPGCAAACS